MGEIDTAMNIMFRSADLTLNTINTALDLLNLFIKPIDTDPVSKVWRDAIDGGEVDTITQLTGKVKEEFLASLKKAGIPFQDSGGIIFTLSADRDKVKDILGNTGVITAEQNLKNKARESLIELNVDSRAEALDMADRLRANGVDFTVNKEGYADGYKFVLSDTDYDMLNKVKMDVAMDMQGEHGKIIKREYEKCNDYLTACVQRIGSPEKEAAFIVDGHTVIATEGKTVTVEKDGRNIANLYKDRDLMPAAAAFIEMNKPALLTREEYEKFKTLDESGKRNFITEKRKEQGIGVLTDTEKETILKYERQRELIEKKIKEMHPEEVSVDVSDYNCEQSLELFTEMERENYETQHDKAEAEHIDAAILNDAAAAYKGYRIDEPEVDYDELAEIEAEIFGDEDSRAAAYEKMMDEQVANFDFEEPEQGQ